MKIENIVASWPRLFFESITEKKEKYLIKALTKANIYWWRAYNIYDDIIDQDSNVSKLPIANIYLIKFVDGYYKLKLPNKFYKFMYKTMITVEESNKKELFEKKLIFKNGKILIPNKLPDFSDLRLLSNKSLALSLGPIAIMYYLHFDYKKINNCINFFKNFLAAKQLSDDAYDWYDDLIKGKITAVNKLIIKKAQISNMALDIYKPESLYEIFLLINSAIGNHVMRLCKEAEKNAFKIGLKQNCKFLEKTILPIKIAAEHAIKYDTSI